MSHKERHENPAGGASRNSRRGAHRRKGSYDRFTPLRRTTKGDVRGCRYCTPGKALATCGDKALVKRVERDLRDGVEQYYV